MLKKIAELKVKAKGKEEAFVGATSNRGRLYLLTDRACYVLTKESERAVIEPSDEDIPD